MKVQVFDSLTRDLYFWTTLFSVTLIGRGTTSLFVWLHDQATFVDVKASHISGSQFRKWHKYLKLAWYGVKTSEYKLSTSIAPGHLDN